MRFGWIYQRAQELLCLAFHRTQSFSHKAVLRHRIDVQGLYAVNWTKMLVDGFVLSLRPNRIGYFWGNRRTNDVKLGIN
jgi:hypothetical protein